MHIFDEKVAQPAITCSKLIKTLEQSEKYVQR